MAVAHKCDRCGGYFDEFVPIKIVPTDRGHLSSKGIIHVLDRYGGSHEYELCSDCNRKLMAFMNLIIKE